MIGVAVFCHECKNPAHIAKKAEKGSLLIVSLMCEDNHHTSWYSLPATTIYLTMKSIHDKINVTFQKYI